MSTNIMCKGAQAVDTCRSYAESKIMIVFFPLMGYDVTKYGNQEMIFMICSIRTLGIHGIRGNVVTAECYISNGLPGFDIVGLPDAAVKEARERVRAAAKNSDDTTAHGQYGNIFIPLPTKNPRKAISSPNAPMIS